MAFLDQKIPDFRLGDFLQGLGLPFRAVAFLFRNRGLKRYAVLPLILNILFYALALSLFFHLLWNWEVGTVAWTFWGPVGGWLASAVNWLGWILKLVVAMLAMGVAFFTFTGVGMVVASPVNDILSEKVEAVHRGADSRNSLPLRFTFKAAMLSLYDSLGNLGRQLLFTLLALPFLLVPFIGFLPLFVVGCYYSGFGFLDTAMARNFLRPAHKRLMTDRHFWKILGFGTAMQACFMIPLLGILLLPVGVTAGTLAYCDEDWESLLAGNGMELPPGFPARAAVAPPQPE